MPRGYIQNQINIHRKRFSSYIRHPHKNFSLNLQNVVYTIIVSVKIVSLILFSKIVLTDPNELTLYFFRFF